MSFPYVETFSGSHQSSMLVGASRPCGPLLLHLDRDLDGLTGLDLDGLRLLAERLVPDVQRVLAGRAVLDPGRAVGIGHAEERVRHHRDPAEQDRKSVV